MHGYFDQCLIAWDATYLIVLKAGIIIIGEVSNAQLYLWRGLLACQEIGSQCPLLFTLHSDIVVWNCYTTVLVQHEWLARKWVDFQNIGCMFSYATVWISLLCLNFHNRTALALHNNSLLTLYLEDWYLYNEKQKLQCTNDIDSTGGSGVLRWVWLNYPELYPQNMLDYVSTPSAAARSSYSCVQHAGNVGGASQLVLSSAQENVRLRARR